MLRRFPIASHSDTNWKKRLFSVAAAHSSWFKLIDQGMRDFDLLARGSGFYVRGPQTGVPIAVVSAHVAAPHRYRKYFPHEWLSFVSDADCRSLLEKRSADGKLITRVAMRNLSSGFRHGTLDLAAFVLDEHSLDEIKDCLVTIDKRPVSAGLEVMVAGFRLLGDAGSGTEGVVPTETKGRISEVAEMRGFIDTDDIETEMGMCGGPILRGDNCSTCIGILEGLVPHAPPGQAESELHRRVGGHSVFIGAKELGMFVHDVETEHVRATSSG